MANVTENHILDGADSRLSESTGRDSYSNDLTISSETDAPSMLHNMGRMSPHHGRPLRDQETQMAELKKENFGLKLRIYHLEEALQKKAGAGNEDWEMNIELNVQLEQTKKEVEDKNELLKQAKAAIDTIETQHQAEIDELNNELKSLRKAVQEMPRLQEALRTAQEDAELLRKEAAEARQNALDAQMAADELKRRNQEMQTDMDQLRAENENLKRHNAPPAMTPTHSVGVQSDTSFQKIQLLEDQLREREKELEELRNACTAKDQRIHELELENLRTTNKMAAAASEHAAKMQELTEEINKLKSQLFSKEEELRRMESEKQELLRQLQEARRLLTEAQEELESLRRKVTAQRLELEEKDRLIEELRRRVREQERELERLRDDLSQLQHELNRLRDAIRERDRIIEDLRRQLREKEAELAQRERDLAGARVGSHTTSAEVQTLLKDIQILREQLRQETQQREQAQTDALNKEAFIQQLKAKIVELENKYRDAEERILQMTTAHAAEIGVMRASLDDLDRKLKHQEAVVQSLRTHVGQLTGENEALREEVEMLRRENEALRARVAQLEMEKREKERLLDQSERHIASLQRALEELREAQPHGDASAKAKLAQLQAKIASLEHGIDTRDSEIASLRQAVITKDKIIKELQQELRKIKDLNKELRARMAGLTAQKEELEATLLKLAKELQAARENSTTNASAYEQARQAVERLQEEVRRLQQQVEELSRSPKKTSISVETTPTKQGASPGSSSTTMIFGSMSENLLILILQKLQELYAEVIAGRADSKHASGSLSSKLEELKKLQKQIESILNRRRKGHPDDQPDAAAADLDGSLRKLEELHQVNEQLLHQLEGEEARERDVTSLRVQLEQSRARVAELERRLKENSRLRAELDEVRERAELLQNHLNTEREDNSRLRAQLSELQLHNLRQSQRDSGEASSMPDLNAELPHESWTASSFSIGDHPELSELISKHREVTRLNRELQRRCEEQLRGDKRQRPASAGQSTSYWQTRFKQQEQALRAEMKQRESTLRAQLRELEERLEGGEGMTRKLSALQQQLKLSEEGRERMREQLASALSDSRVKDEEIRNLKTSLAASQQKLKVLERRLDQVLTEKNAKIRTLESRMKSTESLSEDDSLKRQNAALSSKLANYQEQVAMLNKELELYQKLLHESYQVSGSSGQGGEGLGNTTEKVLQLLEDIRRLRRQLDQSIRRNSALSETLDIPVSDSSTSPRRVTVAGSSRVKSDASLNLSTHDIRTTPHLASSTPYVPRSHTRSQGTATLLEERLRHVLSSSSFKGIDRDFLQELLLYLEQQRRQLDDSKELLERLGQDIPSVSHISVSHHQSGSQSTHQMNEPERSSSRASSVDLSSLHDQLRRTHAAVRQSKSLLKNSSPRRHQQPPQN